VGQREGYLHDYLAAAFIGMSIGMIVSLPAASAAGDWGKFIGALVVVSIFGFIPGGFVSGYINFRFHSMGDNAEMSGLTAGFFTAFVYTIIQLIISLTYVIMGSKADIIFIAWILSVVFAFIFFSIGGYVSGMLERRPFAMPGIFSLSRIMRAPPPPPPPGAVQMCPTCGQPMTFVQQYNRWYCTNCKKYP
jgi:uncharacterized membrane protein